MSVNTIFDNQAPSIDVSMESKIRLDVINCIKERAELEFKNKRKEEKSNRCHSYVFNDLGGFGEELVLYMYPNSIGAGSKGGCAFDNREIDRATQKTNKAREIKCVSLDGTKMCSICKSKNPRFQLSCSICQNDDTNKFILKADSRCGISASAHMKYKDIMTEYIFIICKYIDGFISYKCFKIDPTNEYFYNYVEKQHTDGKGDTVNLLPYSYDFHLSGPILLFDILVSEDNTEIVKYFNIENQSKCDIPLKNENTGLTLFTNNILESFCSHEDKRNLFSGGSIDYDANISFFNPKKKALGKERGNTTRK
jgi:hypothetical protein